MVLGLVVTQKVLEFTLEIRRVKDLTFRCYRTSRAIVVERVDSIRQQSNLLTSCLSICLLLPKQSLQQQPTHQLLPLQQH